MVIAADNSSLRIDLNFQRCGVSSTVVLPAAVRLPAAAAAAAAVSLLLLRVSLPNCFGLSLSLSNHLSAAPARESDNYSNLILKKQFPIFIFGCRLQPATWSFPCRLRWLRRHSLSVSSSALLRSLEDFLLPFEDLRLANRPPPNKAVLVGPDDVVAAVAADDDDVVAAAAAKLLSPCCCWMCMHLWGLLRFAVLLRGVHTADGQPGGC